MHTNSRRLAALKKDASLFIMLMHWEILHTNIEEQSCKINATSKIIDWIVGYNFFITFLRILYDPDLVVKLYLIMELVNFQKKYYKTTTFKGLTYFICK